MTSPARILVVDDEPHILRLLRIVLTKEGHHVTTAEDGGEGLDRIREEVPDIVVLDANMPVLDGYQVCLRVRADAGIDPQPYVLMLTAGGQATDAERAAAAGVDEFMTKPFSPIGFGARVREILEKRS